MTDEDYMRMAIALAVKGEGHVNPNPMVGAVIVKDGGLSDRGIMKNMENFMPKEMP